jgi:chromosome segregation ATPase
MENIRASYDTLLKSSTHVTNKLRQEVQELRSQLETERADREEIETELSELKQKSATFGKDLPEAAYLVNQLRAKRKNLKMDLADMTALLEILEG